jgi:hypothetical protein
MFYWQWKFSGRHTEQLDVCQTLSLLTKAEILILRHGGHVSWELVVVTTLSNMLRRMSKGKGEVTVAASGMDLSEDLNSEERSFVAEAVEVDNVQAEKEPLHGNTLLEDTGMVEVPAEPVNAQAQPFESCPVKGCSYKATKKTLLVNHLARCLRTRVKSLKLEHPDWDDAQVRKGLEDCVEPSYLAKFEKRWCATPECCTILKQNAKKHKACGWNHVTGAKVGSASASGSPRLEGAFRPSDLIEVRHQVAEPVIDYFQQEQLVMSLPDAVSVISDIGWPTLEHQCQNLCTIPTMCRCDPQLAYCGLRLSVSPCRLWSRQKSL